MEAKVEKHYDELSCTSDSIFKMTNLCVCKDVQLCLFVTPCMVDCQAPLSRGLSGKNTGVGCHFLHQGIFLTQGSNPHLLQLLHYQVDSLPLNNLGIFIANYIHLHSHHYYYF